MMAGEGRRGLRPRSAALCIATALAATLAACGTAAGTATATVAAAHAQTISETGSSLLAPLMADWAHAYAAQTPGVSVKAVPSSSGTGIQGQGGNGAALVAGAQRDTTGWYAANQRVYALGAAGDYAGERALVVGSVPGSTVTGYNALEGDLSAAIKADQDVFNSAAASGAAALDPLTGGIAAASLLMALGCGWVITRRLAEYR